MERISPYQGQEMRPGAALVMKYSGHMILYLPFHGFARQSFNWKCSRNVQVPQTVNISPGICHYHHHHASVSMTGVAMTSVIQLCSVGLQCGVPMILEAAAAVRLTRRSSLCLRRL